jgi:hypothetical protein
LTECRCGRRMCTKRSLLYLAKHDLTSSESFLDLNVSTAACYLLPTPVYFAHRNNLRTYRKYLGLRDQKEREYEDSCQ